MKNKQMYEISLMLFYSFFWGGGGGEEGGRGLMIISLTSQEILA